jgi:para-aminobenzoate synthetase/4-amino-4-deoxychorismate lyase
MNSAHPTPFLRPPFDGVAGPKAWLDFISPFPGAMPVQAAFSDPVEVVSTTRVPEVPRVLDRAHALARQGHWVVGYVRYEAAVAFDAAASVCERIPEEPDSPLAWFAAFDSPRADLPAAIPPADAPALVWGQGQGHEAFGRRLEHIHEAIRDGRLYQLNLTETIEAPWPTPPSLGNPAHAATPGTAEGLVEAPRSGQVQALFEALRRAQPQAYAAWIDTGNEQVLSVSPELFFHWDGDEILCRPMKGTAARSADAKEDEALAEHLRHSEKERAENLMIVDLIRNDLSRIALPHSVRVPRLFQTTAWPTVWQMTSDVVAKTRAGLTLADVFRALFPCGSVTGAPKLEAMRLIAELEGRPRGIYCGAVGVIRPGGTATFNVPIRTPVLQRFEASALSGQDLAAPPAATALACSAQAGVWRLSCGIGSGITLDAQANAEWAEWASKRGFLERAREPFVLYETLALRAGQWQHLSEHLERMRSAAQHFHFRWDESDARQALRRALERLEAQRGPGALRADWRIRLSSDAVGVFEVQCQPLPVMPEVLRVQLADRPMPWVHRDFLRFKTSRRAHYEAFAPSDPQIFDTLLWNDQGEVTEFTRGNVAVQFDGQWFTPPLRCALLAGVGRALALREGRVLERVIHREEMAQAQALAFVNSLRGWLAAQIV